MEAVLQSLGAKTLLRFVSSKSTTEDFVWDKNCSDIKSINKVICSSMIVTSYFLPPEFSQLFINPLLFVLNHCQVKEVSLPHS